VAHVEGRNELALLDVDGAPRPAGFHEQIRLAAEEGGDLQDVRGFGGGRGLIGRMDVGEDGQPGAALHFREDAEPLAQAGAAIGADAGAVGLVERRLEDERSAEGLAQGGGQHEAVVQTFNDAGPADEGQRAGADGKAGSDLNGLHRRTAGWSRPGGVSDGTRTRRR